MIVKATTKAAAFHGGFLYFFTAKTILPRGDDSDKSKLPERFISPTVGVYNKLDIDILPGDFLRVEGDDAGDWVAEEYIGRERPD